MSEINWHAKRVNATKQDETARVAALTTPEKCPYCAALPASIEYVGRGTHWWFCTCCARTFKE